MKVICELYNQYDGSKVFIKDASPESDSIIIETDKFQIKLVGEEVVQAISRCTRTSWPY